MSRSPEMVSPDSVPWKMEVCRRPNQNVGQDFSRVWRYTKELIR